MAEEYSFVVAMRTVIIDDAISKWTGGAADAIMTRAEVVNDITSLVFIDEEGYKPCGLAAVLDDMGEPYVLLEEGDEWGECPVIQHRSPDAQDELQAYITPTWTLDCEPF